MSKPAVFLAAVATLFAFGFATTSNASVAKPPATYQGQWWTNSLGCEYSRAGRPGETMWFLIVNTAKKGCPTYITGKSWGGVYKQTGPKVGQ